MKSRIELMSQQTPKGPISHAAGFTLVELVLATLLSALVVGIFSVALSISLRAWERQQNRQPSDVPSLLQLLKWQLAAFEPLQITSQGKKRAAFEGDGQSLAFATAYSVRAISKGLPVIARYVFVPGRGELYYAELFLDPYHPEAIERFLKTNPGDTKSWPHFYVTEVAEFSLSYVGKERETLDPSEMDGTAGVPVAVVVNCSARGSSDAISALMFVNSPFTKLRQGIIGGKANLPGSNFPGQRRTR
jgi:hypothetical protein